MRSRSIQRRLKYQQGDDFAFDMAGVDNIHLHQKSCGVWYEYDCDCIHSNLDMYADWEDDNPARTSKSAKPKMPVHGRSVFTILRQLGKRAKK